MFRQRVFAGVFLAAAVLLIGGMGLGIRGQFKDKEKQELLQSGIVCMEQENYETAIRYFEQELEVSGNRVGALEEEALLYRAEAECRLQDYQAALHTYQILMEKDKKNDLYQRGMALALMETGDLEGALAMHVIDAQVYSRMAKEQIETGQYEEAIASVQQGMAIAGTEEVRKALAYNQAVAYEYMSDYRKALELFEAYVQAYGPDENAEREILFLKTRQGNY